MIFVSSTRLIVLAQLGMGLSGLLLPDSQIKGFKMHSGLVAREKVAYLRLNYFSWRVSIQRMASESQNLT